MEPSLNLVLLGRKGVGKSAAGNTILRRHAFKSGTQDVVKESGTVNGLNVTIYDTPGFCDPEIGHDEIQQMIIKKVFQRCESGPCVFLLVIKSESFGADDEETVENIEKLLDENRLNQTWILITREDKPDENKTIKELINENGSLEKLIQKYDQRYHVLENRKGKRLQVRILLTNILQRSLDSKASDGGRLLRLIPNKRANSHEQTAEESRRIVMLGKTGAGKSATGNTILGKEVFKSAFSFVSVTCECSEKYAIVSNRQVSVIDTPGFFDTKMNMEELMKEIAKSVYISSPGPHAFLIVFPLNVRFTDQEQHIAELTEIMFGEEVLKYSIILFTHGDSVNKEIIKENITESYKLRHLVQQCGGRFHVFNNKEKNNRKQVIDLLQMIDTMIEQNEGEYYSNQMYEYAQKMRQEEQKRKERKTDEDIVELDTRKSEGDRGFEQFFRQYERRFHSSAFTLGHLYVGLGALNGFCIGAAIGSIGGPVGAVVGGAVGVAIGGAVGTAANRMLN